MRVEWPRREREREGVMQQLATTHPAFLTCVSTAF